jgi:tetratricopeptide (TPR) repeat protein
MKVSQNKFRRSFYLVLFLMLAALILFSLMPLVSSVVEVSQSQKASAVIGAAGDRLASEVTGYELVLQREPDNASAWRGLLEAQLRQGNIEGTLTPLAKLDRLSPQTLDYGLLLAQTQQYLEDYAGARSTYQDLLVRQPGDVRVLKGMADLAIARGRPQEAVELVQATIAQFKPATAGASSNFTSLQLLLGEIYSQSDRYGEAIAVYDRAMKDNASDFRPWLAKAQLLKEKGKAEAAEPLFQKAIQLAPVQYKDDIKTLSLPENYSNAPVRSPLVPPAP